MPIFAASTVAIFIACIAIDAIRDRIFGLLRINDRIDALSARVSTLSARIVAVTAAVTRRLRRRQN